MRMEFNKATKEKASAAVRSSPVDTMAMKVKVDAMAGTMVAVLVLML